MISRSVARDKPAGSDFVEQSLGRLYEVAFNTGALTALGRSGFGGDPVSYYRDDMRHWSYDGAIARMLRDAGVVDQGFEEVVRHGAEYLSTKGYLAGLFFFGEYIQRMGYAPQHNPEVLFFGCDFGGDNSLGQQLPSGTRSAKEQCLESYLGRSLEEWEIHRWGGSGSTGKPGEKGEFLHADCLALFSSTKRGGEYRILSIDFGAFSGGGFLSTDISNVDAQRSVLAREMRSMRAKSIFAGMYIDTGEPGSNPAGDLSSRLHVPEGLRDYIGAFKYRDKEYTKFVQAGSYAHSFYEALLEEGKLSPEDRVRFTAVGHSDRDTVSISVSEKEREILGTCHTVYKTHPKKKIPGKRRKLTELIAANAAGAFVNGKGFVDDILTLPQVAEPDGGGTPRRVTKQIAHHEKIRDFVRPQDTLPDALSEKLGLTPGLQLREAHKRLIRGALDARSEDLYVFLTGSPGIGKTTSIVSFLSDHEDEGFLFLYVSPRKQVNKDAIEKFSEECDSPDLLCLNSNREVVEEGTGGPTVEFKAYDTLRDHLCAEGEVSGVRFLDADDTDTRGRSRADRTARQDKNTITGVNATGVGVLNSLFSGVGASLENDLSRQIVATAAVQALRRTRSGDTLKHFREAFRCAMKNGEEPIPEKMRELAGRVKHVFVMVDEITGDPAGAEFLSKLGRQMKKLGLTNEEYGFNAKIIVADASIVDRSVIEQHLSEAESEPDKVFFRASGEGNAAPLRLERFDYQKRYPAVLVNADCYPAEALNISYQIRFEATPFDAAKTLEKSPLAKATLEDIASDVVSTLHQEKQRGGQVIVYIQDKARLAQLIELIGGSLPPGETFEKPKDYIEIHANLPQKEEKLVQNHKNKARVVFMTSSASRGLSFKQARHIFVEIPRFSLEQNLMELIQVIYRGRGSDAVDAEEKALRFYITESVLYDAGATAEERVDSVREGAMNLLTFLLVLKTSIMTRVVGSGRIGNEDFLMVPVGGKNVSFGGESFSSEITGFLKALSGEIRREPKRGHELQENVYKPVFELFSSGYFGVRNAPYASAARAFRSRFLDRAGKSLQELLDGPPMGKHGGGLDDSGPDASVVGSLLVASYHEDEELREEYALREARKMGAARLEKLLNRVLAMKLDDDLPEDLRHKCAAPENILRHLLEEVQGRTQRFVQETGRPDRYYALPIFLFAFYEEIEAYFKQISDAGNDDWKESTLEGNAFRELLESYVKAFFPADDVLPIGYEYGAFPFLLFNSYNLPELRSKLFAEKQMLASNELNVLNLILSRRNTR